MPSPPPHQVGSGPVPELARCVHPTPHSPNQLPRTPAVASRDALAGGSRSAVWPRSFALFHAPFHSARYGPDRPRSHITRDPSPTLPAPRARGGTTHAYSPGLGRMAEKFVGLCFTLRAFGSGLGMVTLSTHPHPHHHRPCERARARARTIARMHPTAYPPTQTCMYTPTHPHTTTHTHTHTSTHTRSQMLDESTE